MTFKLFYRLFLFFLLFNIFSQHSKAQLIKRITKLNSKVEETSGLLYFQNNLWTFNDSGGLPELYEIDSISGEITKTLTIKNAQNIDWEDITQNENFIFISDTGNNSGIRTDLTIYKIDKKQIYPDSSNQTIFAEKITLNYENQTDFNYTKNHNFDCEAITYNNNQLLLFSKNRGDNNCNLYQIPCEKGNYIAKKIYSFDSEGLICGAELSPNHKELILIGYTKKYISFLWIFSDFVGNDFFSGKRKKIVLEQDIQGEAVCYSVDNKVFISAEKTKICEAALYQLIRK